MPALDPLSGNSRPFFQFDAQPSKPLKFAATILHPLDRNKDSAQHLPRPKRDKEGAVRQLPSPLYRHDRHASVASTGDDFDALSVGTGAMDAFVTGSDEWMRVQVAHCVDNAQGSLDLAGKGLTALSSKISDLRDLVTLPTSFSPRASTSTSTSTAQRSTASPIRSPIAGPSAPSPSASPSLSPSVGGFAGNARSFSRTVSAPASAANFHSGLLAGRGRVFSHLGDEEPVPASPLSRGTPTEPEPPHALLAPPLLSAPAPIQPAAGRRKSSWSRSKTGASQLGHAGAPTRSMDVDVNLARNSLTSLPSALFEISNLTLLTLHRNSLTSLPAAIGELHNLRTLNIGNNLITQLPSTILNLSLAVFSPHPNPFTPPPTDTTPQQTPQSEGVQAPSRVFSALETRSPHPVPRLSDLCVNLLIQPRLPSNLPPMLDMFDWAPARGEIHPLLDPEILHQQLQIPSITEQDVRRILQALKSASFAQSRLPGVTRRSNGASGAGVGSQGRVDSFPRSHRPSPPDDASTNPYYYPCPSPRHLEVHSSGHQVTRPTRHVFLQAAERRIEWREVFGVPDLPIEWKGCSPGCLAFLEDEEDEWDLTDASM